MTGFVYAIGDETGRVKIGWSQDPIRRLNKIGSDCSSAVTLLGVVPASRSQEAEAHALLAPWRANREWYRHEGPVVVFVSMLTKPKPRPSDPPSADVDCSGPMHLADYMAAKNLRDEDIAAAIGVSRVSVNRWRRKLRRPNWTSIEAIRVFSNNAVLARNWHELVVRK